MMELRSKWLRSSFDGESRYICAARRCRRPAPAAPNARPMRCVAKLKALRPDLPIEGATAAPIPGMIAIELTGGRRAVRVERRPLSDRRRSVSRWATRWSTSPKQARDEKRKELIAGVSPSDMAVFPAQGQRKAVITVFTDVDCGYCRKLHQEVPR